MASPAVLIVDDHPLFRDALSLALGKAGVEADAVAMAGSIAEAAEMLAERSFALTLLDLNLSDSAGLEGLARLASEPATGPILVVSATEDPTAFASAKSLGAKGFLPKSQPLDAMSEAIRAVLDGGTHFPDMPDTEADTAIDRLSSLTPAQSRVMQHLGNGLLNKQIAYEMGISEATVKAHMTAIFRKLGVNNRTQALMAYRDAVAP